MYPIICSSACANHSDVEMSKITDCLVKFQDTFSKHESDIGLTSLIEHEIDEGHNKLMK